MLKLAKLHIQHLDWTGLSFCSFVRLFTKLPQPGDSDVTFSVFESSYHLLLPVELLKGKGNPI